MTPIWKSKQTIDQLNTTSQNTLVSTLDIKFTQITDNTLVATMQVNSKHHQYMGILHGGASVALAETVGSAAAKMCVQNGYCVGIEINANHLKSVKEGLITATARPFHIGKATQVWEIKITNEADQLICISRLTIANQYLR
jgi:uncharacterized protein (TIGR00369 family)